MEAHQHFQVKKYSTSKKVIKDFFTCSHILFDYIMLPTPQNFSTALCKFHDCSQPEYLASFDVFKIEISTKQMLQCKQTTMRYAKELELTSLTLYSEFL